MQISQAKNAETNFLARLASLDEYNVTSELCVEIRRQPSIEGEQILNIKEQDKWMTPIVRYLKEWWRPEDKMDIRKIQLRVARFIIIDDILYRRGYSLPYLRYATSKEVDYVLHTRGNLWKSCWGKIFSRKGTQSRILLANLTEGRIRPRQSMW